MLVVDVGFVIICIIIIMCMSLSCADGFCDFFYPPFFLFLFLFCSSYMVYVV